MMSRRDSEKPQRILVRAPNWLGDLVMATPAFRALRAGFPGAELVLQLREVHFPLLAGAPWFDELIPVSSYRRGLVSLVAESRALRRRRFDLGVCLPDSFRPAFLMRLAGVQEVVGYRRRLRTPLLHRALSAPGVGQDPFMLPRELHELGLTAALGCPDLGTQLQLFTTPEEESAGLAALDVCGVSANAPRVVLAPGASFGSSKLWPLESYAVLADGLAAEGFAIAVLGAPEEAALAERLCAAMRAPAANLIGRIDLGASKAVIAGARLLVCNDAGARHMAVAFGVPCVVLMGPTALEKTACNLEKVQVLTAEDVDCRPCYLRECPIDHRCLTRISPERALEVALGCLRAS